MKETINDFVGKNNFNTVNTLAKWIENYYFQHDIVSQNYAILVGASGNGKSYLCKLLADTFNVELFRITPNDITSMQDMYDIIKSINIKTLDSKAHKIILVDDFDDYSKTYRKGLLEIGQISRYPVIYAMKRYPSGMKDFIENSLKRNKKLLYVKKPLTSDLMKKFNGKIDNDKLQDLIEKSVSYRGVELGLKSGANELIESDENVFQYFDSIKNRNMKQPVTRKNIKLIFDSLSGSKGTGKSILMVRQALNDYCYRTHVQYEEIEPFELNNADIPIERMSFKPVFKKRNGNNKKHNKQKTSSRKKRVPTIEKTKVEDVKTETKPKPKSSLNKWF